MSQGFKKTKALEVSDTTVFTPPTRADEQRNSRRSQQIANLHQQFQDLKKKIKEVETKNQRILDKIYKAYNFKKKNAYTEEYIPSPADSPVVHFQHKNSANYSGAMSLDAHSNKSDHSEKESKLLPKANDQLSRKSQKSQKYNYSLENGKTDPNITSGEFEPIRDNKQLHLRYTTNQTPSGYPQSFTSVGSRKKLVEELSQEKQYLEQQLTEKSSEISKLRSSLQGFNRGLKGQIKCTLEEFEEGVCQKVLGEIEKAVKKWDQKIKKVTMMLRDKQEELKSTKLLKEGKRRRSASKTKRPSSPPRNNSRITETHGTRENESRSRSKVGEQGERNKKEFQQIAKKYEELIKTKNEEIDKWDKKYKVKERECYELKVRIDMLQKRLTDEERRTSKASEEQDPKSNKKINTESDLLESEHEKHDNFNIFEDEVLTLQTKLQQATVDLTEKSTQLASLQSLLGTAENKTKMLHSEYLENITKTKQKYQEEQQRYRREFEKLTADKNSELLGFKNSVMTSEKKFLEKECECFALENKLKKTEGLLCSRDRKIEELEKLVGDNCPTDRSVLLNSVVLGSPDSGIEAIKKLKEEIEQLEAQLDTHKNEQFELKKKNNYYKNKSEEMERHNTDLHKELEALRLQFQQSKLSSYIGVTVKEEEEQEEQTGLERLNLELQTQQQKTAEVLKEKEEWYDKYQKIKSLNLEKESENIKLKSQVGFAEKNFSETQLSLTLFKAENDGLRLKNKELSGRLVNLEEQFKREREDFKIQLNDIEKKMSEYKDDIKTPATQKEDKNLQVSIVEQGKLDQLNSQNEYLSAKLKEAKAELETHEVIEQKIINEYKVLMEQNKLELKAKTEQLDAQKEQIEDLNTTIRNLTARLEAISQTDSPTKKELKTQLLSRMEELENDLKVTKEINSKLTDMESQLFDQIKIKEEERGELYEELRKKEARIQELQEIIQVRAGGDPEHLNTYNSHISQSTHKRESIKSQSSLKYSSHSQALRKSRMAASGKSGASHEEKLFDLDLSEAGTQFYEQPSQISNISEFFGREELLTDKIKIKRQEQVKLFEKTAAYIKSLKKAIEDKTKRIKLLEKKIELLKQSQLVRKELGKDIDFGEENALMGGTLISDDAFRDYESEHLEQRKGGGYLRRYKQLEHDTKLVREQNNVLTQQVETLEEELLKAQDQENSLVKIKDLYKEEIKKLIKKNEEQTKSFEEELKNERKRVEESESVHSVEAVKQLYLKIVNIAGFMFTEENISSKRKEEKRKELEEYIKVMSNILKLDKKAKDTILECLHK